MLETGNINSLIDSEILTSEGEGTIGSEASFFIVLIFLIKTPHKSKPKQCR